MTKYTYAERVSKKVKQLFKHDSVISQIVSGQPEVRLNGNFCLDYMYWSYYDMELLVTSIAIQLSSNKGKQILIRYNGFDGLLKIK